MRALTEAADADRDGLISLQVQQRRMHCAREHPGACLGHRTCPGSVLLSAGVHMAACQARLLRSHASAVDKAVLGAARPTALASTPPAALQDYRALCHGAQGGTEHMDPSQAGEQLPAERARPAERTLEHAPARS